VDPTTSVDSLEKNKICHPWEMNLVIRQCDLKLCSLTAKLRMDKMSLSARLSMKNYLSEQALIKFLNKVTLPYEIF
jgi:hypothetical protein